MNKNKTTLGTRPRHKRVYHEPDKLLIMTVFLIVIFGLISLASASSVMAYKNFGDAYYYFNHQLFGVGVGLAAFVFFSRLDYRIRTWVPYFFSSAFAFSVYSRFIRPLRKIAQLDKCFWLFPATG
jgi:cell division protein FtsW (lipid II flippase)